MNGVMLVALFPPGDDGVEFVFSFSQEPNVFLHDETCSWRGGVRRKDELSPSHYLVFGGKLQDSASIKQLTFALPVNSLQLICISVNCYQNTSAQQL